MEIRKLEQKDHGQLKELIDAVVDDLKVKDWLIAPTKEEIESVFENNNVEFWGVFDGDTLLSISCLSFDNDDFSEIVKACGIENLKVAEIAECMTLPFARGNNLTLQINQKLVQVAKSMGFDYLVATAHPDNIASNISLQKLGMTSSTQIHRYGTHLRNCFVMKL